MFLQFELWKDCKHGCPFCCNRDIPHVRDKLESLRFAKAKIEEVGNCDSISLIGGEFFDGQLGPQKVQWAFEDLLIAIAHRIKYGHAERGLICTSLMYGDESMLLNACELLRFFGVANRFLLCTSWDTAYRFNPVTRKHWEENVRLLHTLYPEIPLHVEIIMTQAFIESYLSGEFTVKWFEEHMGCKVDFNTPYVPFIKFKDKTDMEDQLPNFFPKRADFFRLLEKASESGDIDLETLLSVGQHSSNLYYTLDDEHVLHMDNRHKKNNTCLREGPCTGGCCGYIDSDRMLRDDVVAFIAARL